MAADAAFSVGTKRTGAAVKQAMRRVIGGGAALPGGPARSFSTLADYRGLPGSAVPRSGAAAACRWCSIRGHWGAIAMLCRPATTDCPGALPYAARGLPDAARRSCRSPLDRRPGRQRGLHGGARWRHRFPDAQGAAAWKWTPPTPPLARRNTALLRRPGEDHRGGRLVPRRTIAASRARRPTPTAWSGPGLRKRGSALRPQGPCRGQCGP